VAIPYLQADEAWNRAGFRVSHSNTFVLNQLFLPRVEFGGATMSKKTAFPLSG